MEKNIYCTLTRDGIEKCLSAFLDKKLDSRLIAWKWEASVDHKTKEFTPLSDIPTLKIKIKN